MHLSTVLWTLRDVPPEDLIAADHRAAAFGHRSVFTGQRIQAPPVSNAWSRAEQFIHVYVNGDPTRVFV